MRKRFVYEWKKAWPFFSFFTLAACAYWLFLRRLYGAILEGRASSLLLGGILPSFLFAGLFVFFGIYYVVRNYAKEFSTSEGVLTFLTPIAPWKILLAKWLHLLFFFPLSFVLIRLFSLCFPLEEELGFSIFSDLMAEVGPFHGLVQGFFFYLNWLDLLQFVLFWSMFLFLGYYVLAWSEQVFAYKKARLGKLLSRILLLYFLHRLIQRLLQFATVHLPILIHWMTGRLYWVPAASLGRLEAPGLFSGVFSPFLLDARPAYSLVQLLGYVLLALLFLWRADACWRKINR